MHMRFVSSCLHLVERMQAIDAHAKAISIDSEFKEAWANMAQAYKDLGIYDKAEQLFTKVLLFLIDKKMTEGTTGSFCRCNLCPFLSSQSTC